MSRFELMITLKCTNRTVGTKAKLKQNAAPGKNFLLAAQCSFSVDNNWNKVFKNGPSKLCGRQLSKNLKGCSLLKDELRPTFGNGKHVADLNAF